MIELNAEQVQAVEQAEQPPLLLNPKTKEEFFLVRKDVFERMQKLLKPPSRAWDDPALNVYEQYRH